MLTALTTSNTSRKFSAHTNLHFFWRSFSILLTSLKELRNSYFGIPTTLSRPSSIFEIIKKKLHVCCALNFVRQEFVWQILNGLIIDNRLILSSPRLRLSLCWWGEEWQDEGLVKRASAADFVNVGGLLTEGEVSRDGRGRTVEEAVPEGAARSAEADSTVRPRPKFFPPSSDLGLTRPSPFPRGTRRASCSRAFRAACGCCISRSRASPPQSPRPSCGSSSRGNIRP